MSASRWTSSLSLDKLHGFVLKSTDPLRAVERVRVWFLWIDIIYDLRSVCRSRFKGLQPKNVISRTIQFVSDQFPPPRQRNSFPQVKEAANKLSLPRQNRICVCIPPGLFLTRLENLKGSALPADPKDETNYENYRSKVNIRKTENRTQMEDCTKMT